MSFLPKCKVCKKKTVLFRRRYAGMRKMRICFSCRQSGRRIGY